MPALIIGVLGANFGLFGFHWWSIITGLISVALVMCDLDQLMHALFKR